MIRELIARQVVDLLEETESQLKNLRIESLQDVREQSKPIVCFTPPLQQLKRDLETFLRERVYKHYRVLRMAQQGRRLLQEMYAELVRAPELLPPRHLAVLGGCSGGPGPPRPGCGTGRKGARTAD